MFGTTNTYQHPDAEKLIPNVAEIIDSLTDLVVRAHDSDDVDLVYVNDNYGDFSAEFSDCPVGPPWRAARSGESDRAAQGLPPRDQVRRSAFYSTPMAYLLNRLGTKRLVLTGQVTEQCILYSALDADCVISGSRTPPMPSPTSMPSWGTAALTMMERNMSTELSLAADCLG